MKNDNAIQRFIYFMNHNKNLTREQQLRRDLLLNNSIVNGERYKGSEERQKEPTHLENTNPEPTFKEVYISPSRLVKFLRAFNGNNILKYTCHNIDSDQVISEICDHCKIAKYSLAAHSNLIAKEFDILANRFVKNNGKIKREMYAKFSAYLKGGSSTWSREKVNISWASQELLDWGNDNHYMVPNPAENIQDKQDNDGYKLPKPFISPISGSRILYFSQLVVYFKSLFHIRQENSLKSILKNYNGNNSNKIDRRIDLSFTEDFSSKIELFTDVESILDAYQLLIRLIAECHDKTEEKIKVELSFYEKDEFKYFCIHDVNNVFNKSLSDFKKRLGTSHENLIKKINGVCDLYVEADFGNNQYARLGLWEKDVKELNVNNPCMSETVLEACVGVKHILKFYSE